LFKNLPVSMSTAFTHVRVLMAELPAVGYSVLCTFANNGTHDLAIAASANGTVSCWTSANQGTTNFPLLNTKLCESGGGVITANATFVVAVGIVVSTTVGSIVMQVNGQQVANVSGVNTSPDATGLYTQFCICSGSPAATSGSITVYYDDVIINDAVIVSAANPNNIISPPRRVYWVYPVSPGLDAQWTPNGLSANWQNAVTISSDYNSAASSGLIDLYTLDVPSGIASVAGSQWVGVCETDDGGAATVTPTYSNGSTTATGSAIAVPSGYKALLQCSDIDPITGNPWLVSNLTGLQVGPTRSA
jgi:hypothetical protein